MGGTHRHTDRQTDRQTDRAVYRVAPQLKICLPTAAMVATGVIVPRAPTEEAPANNAPPPMIPKAVTE